VSKNVKLETFNLNVSLFFSNREAYILLGGELGHEVPQGDVVSPYELILAVELLLIKINNTKFS